MRGEQQNKINEAQKLIHDAAEQAKVVLSVAEDKAALQVKRQSASTAIILGPNGEPLFHLVSTWWSRMVVIGYGVMLGILILMALLMFNNRTQIDDLKQKVHEVEDQQVEDHLGPK
jgi:hypothetical protein